MSETAIRIEGLSKQFRIGRTQAPYQTIREVLTDSVVAPFRRAARLLRGEAYGAAELDESIWALDGVSLEIKTGEVVGIIGRNGAGKSTLLKILSRITEPTRGRVEIHGRVGSLLEVGTGFHPELTGRENIFLNGAILGMGRVEISRKFDEIVEFAEISRFIDTPVKHYSSGMYLRLAFAVAAHLEPEILIVDEVLAVGDARFQKKCLSKMEAVGRTGRTVLFVSHNMPAITRLCTRGILLQEGRVVMDGPAHQVVGSYLAGGSGTTAVQEWSDPADAPGGEIARLCAVRIRNREGRVIEVADVREPVGIEMEFEVLKGGHVLLPHFDVKNEEGLLLFVTLDQDPAWRRKPRPPGRYVSTAWIPANFLREGTLFVHAFLITMDSINNQTPEYQFKVYNAVSVSLVDPVEGDSARGDFTGPLSGAVRPLLNWTTAYTPANQRPPEVFTSPASVEESRARS